MNDNFCPEHSEVMRCLGALEAGNNSQSQQMRAIENKIDSYAMKVEVKIESLQRNSQMKSILDAARQAKSQLLFWALAILGVTFLSGFGTFMLTKIGWK